MTDSEFDCSKKVYFASDFHLGVPDYDTSLEREKKLIRWLDFVSKDAEVIYLVGDIFDFWFEYRTVVPKHFVRLLGKLAELSDRGISVVVFSGNHDMWLFDYFPKELNIVVHKQPIKVQHQGKTLYIGHGDGLGPGDIGYKFIKKAFSHPFCQWLFRWIHPDIGMRLANFWSGKSRQANSSPEKFLGESKEWLFLYSKQKVQQMPDVNYFVFGHRHLPLDMQVSENARYINLGEWLHHCSYGVLDNGRLTIRYFEKD